MTKEEVINKIIDMRKDGIERPFNDYCLSINPCGCCPFHNDDCPQAMISELIDRLIKAEEQSKSLEKTCYKLQQALEEKVETNLEHYRDSVNTTLESEPYVAYKDSDYNNVVDWLLAPYEKPKPKYKLSKFEYDLLEYHSGSKFGFKDFWILEHMQSKGYFKDIPNDVPIRDILDNCEVSD